jgi:ATP-dependent Zn protease
VASQIDAEIKRVVEEAYNEAIRTIEQYIDILHQIAELLITKEKVSGEEIRRLFPEGVLHTVDQSGFNLMGEPAGAF